MNANRRAEILQAVELHDRDLLSEIAELEAARDMLKAAIATPELYVGVVSDILAEERELAIAENSKLRAVLERLVEVAEQMDLLNERLGDLGKKNDTWNNFKSAIAEAKEQNN